MNTKVQVLGRAADILNTLPAADGTPMRLRDLADSVGLHLSTTHRIVTDLVAAGFAQAHLGGRYSLGTRWTRHD